ncbi:MAG TPA: nitrilase-related carbon-nitrogen hydrolase, partial [Desulfuromonadaceae bacterium]|nr:nitrilase-related carbon-nitrogen hydrolase [Desulfuromonadaceae bacterium]
LTDQPTVKRAFYFGLSTGFLCAAPQLFFFWSIFGPLAIVLWLVWAFWIGLFAAIACGGIRRWGKSKAIWLIPILWTGIEYFRSELYYLKFSWLNVGYALPALNAFASIHLGMYGLGFSIFVLIALLSLKIKLRPTELLAIFFIGFIALAMFLPAFSGPPPPKVSVAGVQLEFPSQGVLPKILDGALAKNTNADIFVLSEYALEGGVPDSLKDWCRTNSRYLVVGGKDIVTNHIYYNTAFVVGTNGDIVFKQAKSVPIQFFDDGLPAAKQELWNSPWGKIGICICYDLSYTRVTDELVRQGAQLLIVPTMDVSEWGRHEHELHARVAPTRATEYGVPIFRLASSGISQAVNRRGGAVASIPFEKQDEVLAATLQMPRSHGVLPLDRRLAPLCTGISAIILITLMALTWKDRQESGRGLAQSKT